MIVSIAASAVPIALSLWALLDAAGRPEWVFAFLGRSRTAWVALLTLGLLTCGLGIVAAPYYLVRVRPRLIGVEAGRLTDRR